MGEVPHLADVTVDTNQVDAEKSEHLFGFLGRDNNRGIIALGCVFRKVTHRTVLANCWVRTR